MLRSPPIGVRAQASVTLIAVEGIGLKQDAIRLNRILL